MAKQMSPCTSRELSFAMREAALRYGKLDHRVAEVRDEMREEEFRQSGGITYLPQSRPPDPGTIGLPQPIRQQLQQ